MAKIYNSPSKYIQGPDELANLGTYVTPLGSKALVICSPSGKRRVGDKIAGGFETADATVVFEDFNGECSKCEVERLRGVVAGQGCDVVVGDGGADHHRRALVEGHGLGGVEHLADRKSVV